MSMTDPVADMLTRIRNAVQARHKNVLMPVSNIKVEIARILKEEGYIRSYGVIKGEHQGSIKIELKYADPKTNAITGIKRVSKPGLRKYVGKQDVPRVLNGLGVAIISTSKGVMTDKSARDQGVGGEVLCMVY